MENKICWDDGWDGCDFRPGVGPPLLCDSVEILRPHRKHTVQRCQVLLPMLHCVCVSVCLSVTTVSPTRTVELIVMTFGVWARIHGEEVFMV